MRNALQDTINQYLVKTPTSAKLSKDLAIDYALVKDGIKVTDRFVSVIYDGTFYPAYYN